MSLEQHLPDWLEEGAESSLRDSEDDAVPQASLGSGPRAISSATSNMNSPVVLTPTGGSSPAGLAQPGGSKAKWQDLDKFYADEEEESESEEESSEDGDAEEEEENEESGEEDEETESDEETSDTEHKSDFIR